MDCSTCGSPITEGSLYFSLCGEGTPDTGVRFEGLMVRLAWLGGADGGAE